MTIDEAIKRYEEESQKLKLLCKCSDDFNWSQPHWKQCAEDYEQLAEWLKELKAVKQIIANHDTDKMPEDYWYIDKIREVVEK